ncbi:hypothetical protein SDC9_89223 [bioreactor metagenome]|uniref:Uncharacterized protein n=1 Tax=bioreactor metagenome TaxID=1076179 RepID=A0A644ZPA0_9ZZZZ
MSKIILSLSVDQEDKNLPVTTKLYAGVSEGIMELLNGDLLKFPPVPCG